MTRGFVVSTVAREGGGAVAPAAASPLPCLSSNNCNEEVKEAWKKLGGGHRRIAYVLATEIQLLADRYGIEKLGFLTLTFADPVKDIPEASRRFHSLNTGVLNARYERAISNVERHESQRLHFHLVVATDSDVRTGVDFKAIEKKDYRSAGPALRAEWAFWRKTAPKYGFGRTEFLPIKSTAQGIARYVGKYISKHVRNRQAADRGARLVRFLGYLKGERCASCNFAWNTEGAWIWRHKLKAWATRNGFADTDEIKEVYGKRWAWMLKEQIVAEPITECFPSLDAVYTSRQMEDPMLLARVKAEKILESKQFVKTYILGKKRYEKRPVDRQNVRESSTAGR